MTTQAEKLFTELRIPQNALVMLVGPSGSGKSTFAKNYLPPESIVSSDACRRIIAYGDANHVGDEKGLQQYSDGAFILFHSHIRARLRHNFGAVADATNLTDKARMQLEEIASQEHVKVIYIVFNLKYDECIANDAKRQFPVGEHVIKRQFINFKRSFGFLRRNPNSYVFNSEDLNKPVKVNFTSVKFEVNAPACDVIGDIHGCGEELYELLEKLGYEKSEDGLYRHPLCRVFVSVGDIGDRGPYSFECFEFFRKHVEAGLAHAVRGNHCSKFGRWLAGNPIKIRHGLQTTIDQIPDGYDKNLMKSFIYGKMRPYFTFAMPEGGIFVITHAAFKPDFLGKADRGIDDYCMYGPVEKVDDETEMPVRIAWERDYFGPSVVYGHQVAQNMQPNIIRNTYGIDTGCVFGGKLTALRLPEKELVSVDAKKAYCELNEGNKNLIANTDVPYIHKILETKQVKVFQDEKEINLHVRLRSELERAIESLTTKTISPDKLVWFAPTMSPGPVSELEGYLEDPVVTAKWMFENSNDPANTELIAEVKHMGSRGVWGCWKQDDRSWEIICWTKNGFQMFDDPLRTEVYSRMQGQLNKLEEALGKINFMLLDSEVMPWNLKGAGLVEQAFLVVSDSGQLTKQHASDAFDRLLKNYTGTSAEQLETITGLRDNYLSKEINLNKFKDVTESYCWDIKDINDVRIGFFSLLAYGDKTANELLNISTRSEAIDILNSTFSQPSNMIDQNQHLYRIVKNTKEDLNDLLNWWLSITEDQSVEGIVLKYNNLKQWSTNEFPQQMLKVRGKKYLRIIYGPQYLEKDILQKLKSNRNIKNKLRAAWTQTLLSDTALKKYVKGAQWEAWHSFIVLSAASDYLRIDPRL